MRLPASETKRTTSIVGAGVYEEWLFGPIHPVVRTSSFHVEDTGGPKASFLPASKTRSPLLSVMDFLELFLSLRCPFIGYRTSERQNLHACVLSLLPSLIPNT
ncbi:hypothetical protein V6N11_019755 [Hibiscus sabdariffa]|uniref:Uncharacterized protein n=1 Tax=Hibiscus sabdariffa TaxID=183260 RepID=A0ABR2A648_9ROSI